MLASGEDVCKRRTMPEGVLEWMMADKLWMCGR